MFPLDSFRFRYALGPLTSLEKPHRTRVKSQDFFFFFRIYLIPEVPKLWGAFFGRRVLLVFGGGVS
jgi:hypothetical protein